MDIEEARAVYRFHRDRQTAAVTVTYPDGGGVFHRRLDWVNKVSYGIGFRSCIPIGDTFRAYERGGIITEKVQVPLEP
jgi:hypothetical protein